MKKKEILERFCIVDGSIDILINRMVMIDESLSELNSKLHGLKERVSDLEAVEEYKEVGDFDWLERSDTDKRKIVVDMSNKNIPIVEGMEDVLIPTKGMHSNSVEKVDEQLLDETMRLYCESVEKAEDEKIKSAIFNNHIRLFGESPIDEIVLKCMDEYLKRKTCQ